jgi:hypothetical protein
LIATSRGIFTDALFLAYRPSQRGSLVLALLASVELDPGASRHASLLYEIAKTRALSVRIAATQLEESQVDKLLTQAGETATEYVRERLGKGAGQG